jgi:hypothetical protein
MKTIHCDWEDCKTSVEFNHQLPHGWAMIQWTSQQQPKPNKGLETVEKAMSDMDKAGIKLPPEVAFIPGMIAGITDGERFPITVTLSATICPKCLGEFVKLGRMNNDSMPMLG